MPTYHVHLFATPPPPPAHSDTMILGLRGIQFLSSAIITVLAIATYSQWDAGADRPPTPIGMPELATYGAVAGILGMLVSLEGSVTLVWDTMHYIPCMYLDAICSSLFFAGGCALAYLWRVNDDNPSNDWCHQLDLSGEARFDRCDHFEDQIMASALFQLISFSVSLLLTFVAICRRHTKAVCLAEEEQWLLQDQRSNMKQWMKLYS